MIFILPWSENSTLIGTTESEVNDLDDLAATSGEVDYLLTEANRIFPGARLRFEDVMATCAGARPLLAFAGSATQASREHRIEIDAAGLVSVMGGKYTTFRLMAQQTVDLIVKRWRLAAEPCLTHEVGLLEPVHPVVLNRWQDLTRSIPEELLARLLTRYGAGAFRILHILEFEPRLIQPVCPHHDVMQAELVYALQDELACTISDVLVRRTTIAFSSCQGLDMLSTLADLFQRYARVSKEEMEAQISDYRRLLSSGLSFRGSHVDSNGHHRATVRENPLSTPAQ